MSDLYTIAGTDQIANLIAETPLCWIVPHVKPETALLMPLVIEADVVGSLVSLLGHLPRKAPATEVLKSVNKASFLFLGPHGYIPPSMAAKKDWAPTWNFVSAKITGTLELDKKLTRPALTALVDHLEGPEGWRISELDSRYDSLANKVIGFRATITSVEPRFKLGQDEADEVQDSILDALSGTPLCEWMKRFEVGS